jgi:hypothetical protein
MTGFRLALSIAFGAAVGVTMGAAMIPPAAQAAVEYPWCAQYNGDDNGGRNCGFVSYEQCMETARGAGAFCEINLFYQGPQPRQKQQPRKRANLN